MIDKFLGDGALILFGVPAESADDARPRPRLRADAARPVERWNAKRGFDPPIRIGIGIHTGEVFCGVVGDEARLEFTVLGETVNITARIEQATEDGRRDVPRLPGNRRWRPAKRSAGPRSRTSPCGA